MGLALFDDLDDGRMRAMRELPFKEGVGFFWVEPEELEVKIFHGADVRRLEGEIELAEDGVAFFVDVADILLDVLIELRVLDGLHDALEDDMDEFVGSIEFNLLLGHHKQDLQCVLGLGGL